MTEMSFGERADWVEFSSVCDVDLDEHTFVAPTDKTRTNEVDMRETWWECQCGGKGYWTWD